MRLVAEAHAEQRDSGGLGHGDHLDRTAAPSRAGPAPARSTTARGLRAAASCGSNRSFRATTTSAVERPQRLHEVVGEGVVVVDDEDHAGVGVRIPDCGFGSVAGRNHSRARSTAEERLALASASAYSLLGDGVGDDAGSRLDAADAVLHDRRSDRDGEVAVAGGVEVADGAPVNAPPYALSRRRSTPWPGSSARP